MALQGCHHCGFGRGLRAGRLARRLGERVATATRAVDAEVADGCPRDWSRTQWAGRMQCPCGHYVVDWNPYAQGCLIQYDY